MKERSMATWQFLLLVFIALAVLFCDVMDVLTRKF